MIRALPYAVGVSLLVWLVGCATNAPESASAHPEPSVATIKGYDYRNGAFDWGLFSIEAIDNDAVSGMCFFCDHKKHPLLPGPHVVVVEVQFNRTFGRGPYGSVVAVPFVARAGVDYALRGSVRDDKVAVWVVEDSSGIAVAQTVFKDYVMRGVATPVVIPVK